jgi:hypothetical protein
LSAVDDWFTPSGMKIIGVGLLVGCVLTTLGSAFASEGALEAPYHPGVPNVPVINDLDSSPLQLLSPGDEVLPAKTDTIALIRKMTPIKDQGYRGDCSVFSSTALLEAMLILRHGYDKTLELSEEWLEYVDMHTGRGEGSKSYLNFEAFKNYGSSIAKLLPYDWNNWTNASVEPAADYCESLHGADRKTCLLGQRNPKLLAATDAQLTDTTSILYDPTFLKAREAAYDLRDQYLTKINGPYLMTSLKEVKTLLAHGIPVSLDVAFFNGAWNHQDMVAWGLTRSMTHWHEGLVGYPEVGSVDRKKSLEEPDGHSVMIVGYDDNYQMTTRQLMTDGTTKEFTYTGAFFFKNSWGTDTFGTQTTIDGESAPGYGIITAKYAIEFGQFFQLNI